MVKKLLTKIYIFIFLLNVKGTSKLLLHISVHLITVRKKNVSLEKPVTY